MNIERMRGRLKEAGFSEEDNIVNAAETAAEIMIAARIVAAELVDGKLDKVDAVLLHNTQELLISILFGSEEG